MKRKRILSMIAAGMALTMLCAVPAFAAGTGDVSNAVEQTWTAASGQLKTIVNNVVFPAIDMILAMGTKYGVVKTKLAERGFTHWLEIPFIDYD